MINNRLHTPDGVRDYLPEDLAVKIELEQKLGAVFNSFCYSPVSSPMFEFLEVFEGTGGVSTELMYKFLDRDGSILTLRPDMTPAIARIAATVYDKGDIPLRLCYFDNVFRYNENYQGKLKEFTQAGIELIGNGSDDANAEAIAVAAMSLVAAGLDGFRIDVGQTGFLSGILDESGLSEEVRCDILGFVAGKEFTAVEEIIGSSDVSANVKSLLTRLPFMIGGIDIVRSAKDLTNSRKSLEALADLERIYDILLGYGVDRYVMFDLSMVGNLNYYTGLIFRGYASGSGSSVLDGGRYDGLLSKFGAEYPAVGFSIKCNRLISAVMSSKSTGNSQETGSKSGDTLIAYSEAGKAEALKIAAVLRASGHNVENSLTGTDYSENRDYAAKKGFGGMLYFIDSNTVMISNLLDNTEERATVEELLKEIGGAAE